MSSSVTTRTSVRLEGNDGIVTLIHDVEDTVNPFGISTGDDDTQVEWFSTSEIQEFLTVVKNTFDL